MKKYLLISFFIICVSSSLVGFPDPNFSAEKVLVNDVSRLNPTSVRKIYKVKDEDEIRDKILEAKRLNLKVSMAGQKHSQGGHQFSEDGIVLDMLEFNKILSLDEKNKVITVQSGATWDQIQKYINAFGLALKVMQTSNIFTVGGSMSLNIHGRDPNYRTIRDCIKSFRLMLADGKVANVSRNENDELFNLVIGGMGLFGVILDVDIELMDNVVYEKHTRYLDYKNYPELFQKEIQNNKKIGLYGAALSIAPGKGFLKDISETTYILSSQTLKSTVLHNEDNIFRNKFLLNLSRNFSWGKKLRWSLQKTLVDGSNQNKPVSRNNAMREPIKFLEYHSKHYTDILQEYFIPMNQFASFIDAFRDIVLSENINLIHVGIRYVSQDKDSLLSYAQRDSFSIVIYVNQGLSEDGIEKAKQWTKKLVDLALQKGGSYYLAYQLFPSQEQLKMAYPRIDEFLNKKKLYDPELRFINKFYEKYASQN